MGPNPHAAHLALLGASAIPPRASARSPRARPCTDAAALPKLLWVRRCTLRHTHTVRRASPRLSSLACHVGGTEALGSRSRNSELPNKRLKLPGALEELRCLAREPFSLRLHLLAPV